MKIVDARIWLYHTPLTEPVAVRPGRVIASRDAMLLSIQADDGRLGWGEAAPLPGFSRETLDEVVPAAVRLVQAITESQPVVSAGDMVGSGVEGLVSDLPSLEFALDACVESLVGPGYVGSEPVPVARLLQGYAADIPSRAAEYVRRGYRALKVKVGRGPVDDDVALIRAVAGAVDSDVELRLDANRSWSWAQAIQFAEELRDVSIAYVEEPLRESHRLAELSHAWGLPVALDESLLDSESTSTTSIPDYAAAIVVKPTLLGRRVRTLMEASRAGGVRAILSACYETGVGTAAIVRQAAQIGARVPAVGIGTIAWLASDCLNPAVDLLIPMIGPEVVSARSIQPDRDRLTPVPLA